jgi:hypothetical protein
LQYNGTPLPQDGKRRLDPLKAESLLENLF